MSPEILKEADLGLAIAKDLVKLMNGVFEITVDGDLFKATVMMEKA